MKSDISGVILAGGENKRFGGSPKTSIIIGGKPIIERITHIIGDIFDEIIIVSNDPLKYNELTHFKIVNDVFLKAGPLGGLHASLKASTKDAVFVFAGDMPFLDKDIIIKQIEKYHELSCDALVPRLNDYPEPLHSIYNKSLLPRLEEYLTLTTNYAVYKFLSEIDTQYMEIPDSGGKSKPFTNINSPSDLTDIK